MRQWLVLQANERFGASVASSLRALLGQIADPLELRRVQQLVLASESGDFFLGRINETDIWPAFDAPGESAD